jgi:hypothetical protein
MRVTFDPAIAWWSAIGIPFIVYEQDSEIYAALLSGSAWQTEPITASTQSDCSPTIAIDSAWFQPHVAWITDDSISGEHKIAYAVGILVGPYIHWGVQTLVGSDLGPYGTGAAPSIAVTSEGIAHIVYRGGDYGNYHIHHAWNDAPGGTNWNYEILYSGNANDFSSALIFDRDGNLHLAVSGNDGWGFPGRVFYFFKPVGQPWQQYELASLSGSAVQPSISFDENDAPHILWMETSGNFYTGNIFYSARDSTGTWQITLVLGNDHFVPSFEVDDEGYGHFACHTGGNTGLYDIYHVQSSGVLTGVDEYDNTNGGCRYTFDLWPNPVPSHTEITYGQDVPGRVTLKLYNIMGEEIMSLVDEWRPVGIHKLSWRPQGLSAGIYFLYFQVGDVQQNTKCVLLPR